MSMKLFRKNLLLQSTQFLIIIHKRQYRVLTNFWKAVYIAEFHTAVVI